MEVKAQEKVLDLLKKGPIAQVYTNKKGGFKETRAIVLIKKPIDRVWAVISNFSDYKNYTPNLLESEVKKTSSHDDFKDVNYEIEVPGLNTKYTFRYYLHKEEKRIEGLWVDGDLKNSYAKYHLVKHTEKSTLFYYTLSTKNLSAFINMFDDKDQSITAGLNTATALIIVRCVKKRSEEI